MKKTFFLSVMTFMVAMAVTPQTSYANKEMKAPGSKFERAFFQQFPQASQVVWSEDQGKFVVRFNSYNREVTAVFDNHASLISTLIYSDSRYIPFDLQSSLAKKYPGYAVQCMKEFITKDSHSYYFLLRYEKENKVKWLNVKSDGNKSFLVIQQLQETV